MPAHRCIGSIILVYHHLDDHLVLLHYPSISATSLGIVVGLAGLDISWKLHSWWGDPLKFLAKYQAGSWL